MKLRTLGCVCVFALAMSVSQSAFAQTQLRMTWYSDGNEGEVITDIIRKFEAKNPDIKVSLIALNGTWSILAACRATCSICGPI